MLGCPGTASLYTQAQRIGGSSGGRCPADGSTFGGHSIGCHVEWRITLCAAVTGTPAGASDGFVGGKLYKHSAAGGGDCRRQADATKLTDEVGLRAIAIIYAHKIKIGFCVKPVKIQGDATGFRRLDSPAVICFIQVVIIFTAVGNAAITGCVQVGAAGDHERKILLGLLQIALMGNTQPIQARRKIIFIDLLNIIAEVIPLEGIGTADSRIEHPGPVGSTCGFADEAHIQVMNKSGGSRIECIGRQGPGWICPHQRSYKGSDAIVIVQAIALTTVGQRIAGNQAVGTFRCQVPADMLSRFIDVDQSPARLVVGTIIITGSMYNQRLQC